MSDTLRQQLTRAGCLGPIVGGLDGTYEQWAEHYQPHFHLIAPASARKAFETLRPLYPQTATGSAGLVIKPVTDLASGLSYCQKASWSQRVHFEDALERERSAKRRLEPEQELEWLSWQASRSLASLLFLYGARRYGHVLRRHQASATTGAQHHDHNLGTW